MSKIGDVDAKAVSTTQRHDPLQTKYYCQVTQKRIVETVMEITATEVSKEHRLPLRYVLVVDVSGSMDDKVGGGSESLLDRVKIFADLVIQNVAHEDSIALVTFSHDVQVDMSLRVMTKEAKNWAKEIVRGLSTRGQTNLEIGLLTGLLQLKKNPSPDSRDLIIVFTDGMANQGETDPAALVKKYKDSQNGLGKSSCVPLSAFTIGQYAPVLLNELAGHLGSEAFYWLNEDEEFEADMLIPVFLREETRATDVTIEMKCLEGVTFSSEDASQKHLLESTDDTLKYFIHSIPAAIKKNIPFTLLLPQDKLENLDGKTILDIQVIYLDGKMAERRINDHIELISTTLSDVKPGAEGEGVMDAVTAFSVSKNKVTTSWTAAQMSLVAVAGEKYRRLSLIAINNAMYFISKSDMKGHASAVKDAILEINEIKKQYTTLLGVKGKYVKMLSNDANDWIAKLNFGKTIKTEDSLGRLFAMQSSIATQMPTAKGVFDPKLKQPYLPPQIEKKLRHYEKIVKKTKKEKKTFQATKVFKAQNVLVSESLREKKVDVGGGARQETLTGVIVRCGGRPVPNVNTVFNNTFLVCSDGDFKKNTVLVRDAKRAKIPIVREKFIYDCIQKNKILDLKQYLLNPDSIKVPVN